MTTVSASGSGGTASDRAIPHVTFTNEPNLSPDLRVTKTVHSTVDGYDVPEHAKFQFVLKLNGEIAAGEKYTLSDQNGIIVRKRGTATVDFETDENGIFELEDGQTATFEYVGNNVPYEVTERTSYWCPVKENGALKEDPNGYTLYRRTIKAGSGETADGGESGEAGSGGQGEGETGSVEEGGEAQPEYEDTPLHQEYQYQLRGMAIDGYAPESPIGGSSGNVVPDMESIRFVNKYTPNDAPATELKVTKTISFPEGYEMPEAIKQTRFWFHLEIENSANREYTVLNPIDEQAGTARATDQEGDFFLYPGETAVFAGVSADEGYRVSEITDPIPDVPPLVEGGAEEIPPILAQSQSGDSVLSGGIGMGSRGLSIGSGLSGGGNLSNGGSLSSGGNLSNGGSLSGSGNLSGGGMVSRPGLIMGKGWPAGWWPTGATVAEGDRIPASPVTFNNANTSFRVRKTMNDNIEPEGVEFTFQLVDAQNNPMAGAVYYRYNISTKELLPPQGSILAGNGGAALLALDQIDRPGMAMEEGYTDENGYFCLAAGEEAIFCGIQPDTSYTIKEIGRLIIDEETGEAKPDPSYAEQPDQSGTVSGTGQITTQNFINSRMDVQGTLTVTKQVENAGSEGSSTDDDFHFFIYRRLSNVDDVKRELKRLVKANPGLRNTIGTDTEIDAEGADLNTKVGTALSGAYGWKKEAKATGATTTGTTASAWTYTENNVSYEIYVPLTGTDYEIVTGDVKESYTVGDTDRNWEEGEFTIKAGQTARFYNLSANALYRVEEAKLTPEYIPRPAATYISPSVPDKDDDMMDSGIIRDAGIGTEMAGYVDADAGTEMAGYMDADAEMEMAAVWNTDMATSRAVDDAAVLNPVKNWQIIEKGTTVTIDKNGVKQTVARKTDDSYEYIQTAVMPEEGLALAFTNLYKPKKVNIEIVKVSDQNLPLEGAEFMLYLDRGKENKVLPMGAPDTYRYTTAIAGTGEEESSTEGLSQNTSPATVTIPDLKPGTYWLYEEKAPSGYRLLPGPIEIQVAQTVDGLQVTIDGIPYNPSDNTVEVGSDTLKSVKVTGNSEVGGVDVNGEIELTIPNHYFYALPSSGGMGIYWYSIGGMLLMMAASLILYRNKYRGEVLKD